MSAELRRRLRRSRWAWALAVAALLALIWRFAASTPEPVRFFQSTSTQGGGKPKGAVPEAADPWALLARAQAEGNSQAQAIDNEAELQDMQQLDREWCSASEVARRNAAMTTQDERIAAVASQVFEAANQRLLLRWQRLLQARSDPLSQGAYALLGGPTPPGSAQRPSPGLREMALNASDPRLLSMLAGRTCTEDRACRNQILERWRQLDPGNAMPWLWQLAELQAPADATEIGQTAASRLQALQGLAHASHWDDGSSTFFGLLREVNGTQAPGLYDTAAQLLLHGMDAARVFPRLGALSQSCRSPTENSALAQACTGAAEVLWQHGNDRLMRSIALQTAGGQASNRQAPHWQQRAQQLMAQRQWADESLQQHFDGLLAMSRCEPSQRYRQRLVARLQLGEWASSRRAMAEEQVDEVELVRRYLAKGTPSPLRPAAPRASATP
jgi:hypothetical protein